MQVTKSSDSTTLPYRTPPSLSAARRPCVGLLIAIALIMALYQGLLIHVDLYIFVTSTRSALSIGLEPYFGGVNFSNQSEGVTIKILAMTITLPLILICSICALGIHRNHSVAPALAWAACMFFGTFLLLATSFITLMLALQVRDTIAGHASKDGVHLPTWLWLFASDVMLLYTAKRLWQILRRPNPSRVDSRSVAPQPPAQMHQN